MKIKKTFLFALLLGVSEAADWNYLQHGKDWKDLPGSECGETNQSPIDLKTSATKKDSSDDKFQKHYQNFKPVSVGIVENTGLSVVSSAPQGISRQYLISDYAKQPDGNGGTDKKFNAEGINFRWKSEHTIDGERMAIEMQIAHKGFGDKQLTLGVLFDTEKGKGTDAQVAIIDEFFGSLKMTEKSDSWETDQIPIGQLLSVLDTEQRWIYEARDNYPPCTAMTYFTVLKDVYPIKQAHVDLIKAQTSRTTGVPQDGNWRATQATNGQNLKLFFKDRPPKEVQYNKNEFQVVLLDMFTAILIIWCVILFFAIIYLVVITIQRKKHAKQWAEEKKQQQQKQFQGYQEADKGGANEHVNGSNVDTDRNMVN